MSKKLNIKPGQLAHIALTVDAIDGDYAVLSLDGIGRSISTPISRIKHTYTPRKVGDVCYGTWGAALTVLSIEGGHCFCRVDYGPGRTPTYGCWSEATLLDEKPEKEEDDLFADSPYG